jgi:hypothetical protein
MSNNRFSVEHAWELAAALGRNGYAHPNFQAFIQHPNLAAQLAAFANKLLDEHPETDLRQAAQIMGNNFFGYDDVCALFKVDISDEERRGKSPIPFSPNTLKQHKDTHTLIFVPSGSLDDILRHYDHVVDRNDVKTAAERQGWEFMTERRWAGWHLIANQGQLKGRTWNQQCSILEKPQQVVSVRAALVTLCARYQRNGIDGDMLFPWRCCLHEFQRDDKTLIVGSRAGETPVTVVVDERWHGHRLMTEIVPGT